MSDNDHTKEENILSAVKRVLTEVIKDTATGPGMKHPLSDNTINGLRDCLILISQREQELAKLSGRTMEQRPHFKDEARQQGDVVVSIDSISRNKDKK
jgi:hypothetical protein